MINKKAAMFGLDARIALAIFGALSVISGAALYSAIKQSKVISLVTSMNEVAKAYESYLVDTGSELPFIDQINLNAAVLVDNTIKASNTWKGPYLSYKADNLGAAAVNTHLINPAYTLIFFSKLKTTAWVKPITTGGIQCSDKNQCAIFVNFRGIPNDLAKQVDIHVDGSDSELTGKVRLETETATTSIVYFQVKGTTDLSVGSVIY